MKEKRLNLGRFEIALAMRAEDIERIRGSALYQRLLRPIFNGLTRSPDGIDRGEVAGGASAGAAMTQSLPDAEAQEVLESIVGIEWYHTIELPHNVATPGFVDHRPQLRLYGLPEDMRGVRALDVATYDGFWAFEMERRGAEVVAIDIGTWADFDIPRAFLAEAEESGTSRKKTGDGFWAAHKLKESKVKRHIMSVYELSPSKLGTFDVVFLSDLLLHLRDPQRALEGVCSVVGEGGMAIIGDVYNPRLEGFRDLTLTEFASFGEYVWWLPSTSTLKAMMNLAGFKRVDEISRFQLEARSREPIHKIVLHGYPDSGQEREENNDIEA
jgi:tRNA (mo5U34)-methyltransferase